jgi:hypothetical protein
MSLTKHLRNKGSGQSVFEYLIIFVAISSLCVWGFWLFMYNLRTNSEGAFQKVAAGVIGG